MRCIFHCAEDCWSEKPGKHDGPRYKKMRLDVSGDLSVFGIPHFTYFILGHVTSVSGVLNIMVLWVLEHRADVFFLYLCSRWCCGANPLQQEFEQHLRTIETGNFNKCR